ncbi:collagen alpha-1(I) chain-like [Phaenicophaeus curvirostris]|uniref:collagen alpha-1(I) chain-like n=1 Tax=Phaenicophaeus curvirostris TaxID=33595 RepID=UPI0037F0D136
MPSPEPPSGSLSRLQTTFSGWLKFRVPPAQAPRTGKPRAASPTCAAAPARPGGGNGGRRTAPRVLPVTGRQPGAGRPRRSPARGEERGDGSSRCGVGTAARREPREPRTAAFPTAKRDTDWNAAAIPQPPSPKGAPEPAARPAASPASQTGIFPTNCLQTSPPPPQPPGRPLSSRPCPGPAAPTFRRAEGNPQRGRGEPGGCPVAGGTRRGSPRGRRWRSGALTFVPRGCGERGPRRGSLSVALPRPAALPGKAAPSGREGKRDEKKFSRSRSRSPGLRAPRLGPGSGCGRGGSPRDAEGGAVGGSAAGAAGAGARGERLRCRARRAQGRQRQPAMLIPAAGSGSAAPCCWLAPGEVPALASAPLPASRPRRRLPCPGRRGFPPPPLPSPPPGQALHRGSRRQQQRRQQQQRRHRFFPSATERRLRASPRPLPPAGTGRRGAPGAAPHPAGGEKTAAPSHPPPPRPTDAPLARYPEGQRRTAITIKLRSLGSAKLSKPQRRRRRCQTSLRGSAPPLAAPGPSTGRPAFPPRPTEAPGIPPGGGAPRPTGPRFPPGGARASPPPGPAAASQLSRPRLSLAPCHPRKEPETRSVHGLGAAIFLTKANDKSSPGPASRRWCGGGGESGGETLRCLGAEYQAVTRGSKPAWRPDAPRPCLHDVAALQPLGAPKAGRELHWVKQRESRAAFSQVVPPQRFRRHRGGGRRRCSPFSPAPTALQDPPSAASESPDRTPPGQFPTPGPAGRMQAPLLPGLRGLPPGPEFLPFPPGAVATCDKPGCRAAKASRRLPEGKARPPWESSGTGLHARQRGASGVGGRAGVPSSPGVPRQSHIQGPSHRGDPTQPRGGGGLSGEPRRWRGSFAASPVSSCRLSQKLVGAALSNPPQRSGGALAPFHRAEAPVPEIRPPPHLGQEQPRPACPRHPPSPPFR